MSTVVTQSVSAVERFGFTLFFATAVHAVAILGLTFTFNNERPEQKTIEITLAHFQQEKAPKQADFIAQANQEGSGESQQKHLPATPQKPQVLNNSHIQAASPAPAVDPFPPKPKPSPAKAAPKAKETAPKSTKATSKQKVVTAQKTPKKAATKAAAKPAKQASPSGGTPNTTSLLARSLEIASLQAEIDSQREYTC